MGYYSGAYIAYGVYLGKIDAALYRKIDKYCDKLDGDVVLEECGDVKNPDGMILYHKFSGMGDVTSSATLLDMNDFQVKPKWKIDLDYVIKKSNIKINNKIGWYLVTFNGYQVSAPI